MPQSATIDLPLVLSPRGGLTLVRPIGFPDIALAAGNEASAIRAVRRRVLKRCSGMLGSELISCMVRGESRKQTIEVEIAPEKTSSSWRDPIVVQFDTFVWQQGEAIVIAYVPPLDLTVVATPQTNLAKLVQEQIRSAIRRRGMWSLVGLARIDRTDGMKLVQQTIKVQTPTPAEHAVQQQERPRSKTPTLRSVATRLHRKSLRPAYFRDAEVDQLSRLLSAEPSRSILLVGPSGVGKTAIFHEWVRRRGTSVYDKPMATVACWSTDGSRLISGQSGFGMWQQQCLQMAEEAKRYPSVLHLGNLVELSESGRLRGSGGCGSLLAPRLADGSLRAVIECTPEQLTRIRRVEPRLVQALTILRVEEPSPEQTRSILLEAATAWRRVDVSDQLRRRKHRKAKRSRNEKEKSTSSPAHGLSGSKETKIVVQPEALQMLDRLHRRFRTDAAAPGRPLSLFHAVMSELEQDQTLDVQAVIEAFGRQTGLPRFLIDDAVRPDLLDIQKQLMSQVRGQQVVIETLVDMIATLAADLARGDRPLASMMLIGPTGVGKTETAKALARLIYSDVSRLVRIDMSELSTPSAVGRLIGDALHPEGLLTSAVRAQPFSLVLLDEFEKAHPTVFDLLLQVLGEGRLTDGRGRLADFRNSIVLMTSNLGVDTFRSVPLGLAVTQQKRRYENHFEKQVRDFLRPEMFNRIDRILTYEPLDSSTVQQIAQLRLDELKRRDGWQTHGEGFDVDSKALKVLTRLGYEPQYGARPLTRQVERSVVVPLAEAICNSGRMKKLNAKISATNDPDSPSGTVGSADESAVGSADQSASEVAGTADGSRVESAASATPTRLVVDVTSEFTKRKRTEASLVALIEEMSKLRRRGQSLDRCDAVRRLRNRYTMVNRKLKTLLRRTKTREQREKIRYGPLGVDRMQTRERILLVRALCDDINAAEADLLARFYRGDVIEQDETSLEVEAIRDRLWDTLCELHSESETDNQRMTLVATGSNLAAGNVLFQAYRRFANQRGWNLQVHSLLRRGDNPTMDRRLDCPGWSDDPAFRVSTDWSDDPASRADDEQAARALENWMSSERRKPALVAHRLIRVDALATLPQGTLALMLTFRGKNAGLIMGGESGVHTFRKIQAKKQASSEDRKRQPSGSILVSKHRGMPIEYIAPQWLARREFQVTGHPRRWYDNESGLVQDMNEDGQRTVKMDREGRWLETFIEKETQRRIWAELDRDFEAADTDAAVDHDASLPQE